ncbi:MAG: SHOCT domain-containing protein [Actinomycetota bacterium]|nr:SHOCT domain-containing protein [Actinomycetota bacterium]
MGRSVLGGLVVACAFAIGVQPAATAQPKGDGLRQCFGDTISQEEMEMDCVKVEGGEWTPVGGSEDVSSWFGTFLFVGLLLALLPAFVGASLAKDAGVAGAAGFGIGLVGSWIGVIGLYLYGHSQKRGTPVVQAGPRAAAESPGMGPVVGAGSPAPEPSTAAERLKTLKDLLDQGLITQAEYDARRAATIEAL